MMVSLTSVYQSCYPLSMNLCYDDAPDDDFQQVSDAEIFSCEDQRLGALVTALTNTITYQLIKRLGKVIREGEVLLSYLTAHRVVLEMMRLGDSEPYGVRGCSLFINFVDSTGRPHKLGNFPLDPNAVSTYELHLTVREDAHIAGKIANMFRRLAGHQKKVLVDKKFSLSKKKLYRSNPW